MVTTTLCNLPIWNLICKLFPGNKYKLKLCQKLNIWTKWMQVQEPQRKKLYFSATNFPVCHINTPNLFTSAV